MNFLSLSESNLINSILNNPEEDFQKIVGLIEKKIKQSVDKYKSIYENSIEGVCIVDFLADITFVNQRMIEISGYSSEEMIGKSIFSLMDQEEARNFKNRFENRKRGISEKYEVKLSRKNGEDLYVKIKATPQYDESGNFNGTVAFIEDITEKRINEQLLRESEEKFRTMAEQSLAAIGIFQNNEIKYANEVYSIFTGIPLNEIYSMKVDEFLEKVFIVEDREWLKEYSKVSQSGERITPTIAEGRFINIDNEVRWALLSSKSILFQGKPASMHLAIDITERRQAEADLKREKLFTEEALNAQRDTFFVFEPSSGKAIRWNKAFREISGYSDEEILAMRAPDSYYDEKNLQRAAEATLLIEAKSASIVKMDLITKDGNSIPFEYIGSSITDEEGNLKYIVSVGRDITDRNKAEQIIKETEARYKSLYKNIPVPTYTWQGIDNELILVDYNEAVEKITKGNIKNIIGVKASELYSDNPEIHSDLHECLKEKSSFSKELSYSFRSMDLHRYLSVKYAYVSPDLVLVHTEDITEKKEAEQKLRESEEKYRSLSDYSMVGISIIQDMQFKYVNQKIADNFEYTIEELLNVKPNDFFTNLVHPEHLEYAVNVSKKNQEGRNPQMVEHAELHCLKKNGDPLWLEFFARSIQFEGRPAAMNVSIDITEKLKDEQKLKESEEFFRTIAEQSFMGIGILQDDKLIYANMKLANMYGYNVEEFIGKTYFEFLNLTHPEDRAEVIRKVKKRDAETLDTLTFNQFRAFKKTGELFWANIYSRLITYQGKSAGLVTILDITEMKTADLKLRESEEKYRTITEGSHLAISIMQDDVVKYTNQKMADLTGYSIKEILSWKPLEYAKVLAPDSLEQVIEQVTKKQRGDPDVLVHYPIHVKKKSGELVWADNISTTIMYEGQPADLVTQIDITELKKAEQELKESEEKFRTITEQSFMGIIILQDGLFKYFNQRAADINGYSEEEIQNWKPHEFAKLIHPEDRDFVMEQARKKQGGEIDVINRYNYRMIKKSGEIAWMDNYSKTINFEGRSADLIMTEDITDKIIAEQQLKESEENYRNLIETSSMGLLEIDNVSKNLRYINPRLLEILEYNEDELLKFDIFDRFIHPEDLKEILDFSQERKLEFRIFSKSGKVKWMSGNRLHYYDEKGDLMYVRFWLQDITEKKELEQIKSNLLIRFSHEFKTPLISIKGFSDLILEEYRDNVNEKIVSFLEKIMEGANTLNSLTDRFIESSHLDENLVTVNIKIVNIAKLINRVLVELEGDTKSRQHIIDLIIEKDLLITCDPEKISLAISNLLLNASKFTPQGGLITVSTTIENGFVIISIKDNGIGFDKEELERLFKPFGKIERYGQGLDIVPDGMGMGLYITKKLVELHKGMIWAESAGRNKGSIFNVKIPINL